MLLACSARMTSADSRQEAKLIILSQKLPDTYYIKVIFMVTLDFIMNLFLFLFFLADFPRFLMGILHKTACWKPFFLAEPPSSHLGSFFLAAHPRQRQWPGCSQWHSSPSRQLWTPRVGHEKKKNTKWWCQSRGKTLFFFFPSILFF